MHEFADQAAAVATAEAVMVALFEPEPAGTGRPPQLESPPLGPASAGAICCGAGCRARSC
jgi:hypothetical protein